MNIEKKIRIFIVDDNKLFALTLKSYIENTFLSVPVKIHLFETGEKCLEEFDQLMPEIVILDFFLNSKLPGAINGLKVLSEIKGAKTKTSVIMLTTNDQIDIALNSFHDGASDYIVKSGVQFQKIIDSILKILAKREVDLQIKENETKALNKIIADKELHFHDDENKRRAAELIITNKELDLQNIEKEKRAVELINVLTQKAEVERSHQIIEEKIKEITDSINYAKRIQEAKLPKKVEIYTALTNSFILLKPKAIVSGDFYFFHKNDTSILIAAVDCTGHGIPGAFMSMIGSEKLTEIASQNSDLSEILRLLNLGIKNSLQQSESEYSTRDGMDIAICSIDLVNNIVSYAGANRPFWLIRNGQKIVEEIKATKKAIGGLTDDNQYFESHELKLQLGDTFYISTDGYADQFGGPRGKKLRTKYFKELLVDLQGKPMQEQKLFLDGYIERWRGDNEQVDDVLVIGVQL